MRRDLVDGSNESLYHANEENYTHQSTVKSTKQISRTIRSNTAVLDLMHQNRSDGQIYDAELSDKGARNMTHMAPYFWSQLLKLNKICCAAQF